MRVALPLTTVTQQVTQIGAAALLAFALAAPVAVALAWLSSALLSRRVQAIASAARRYGAGDIGRPSHDYTNDELGDVARVLDASVQDLGRRAEELARDRAQMEAILSGMVEGVLVVNRQGRLQLVNRAAEEMLNVDASAHGRLYLEVIRHPDISAQLTTALGGETSHHMNSLSAATRPDPSSPEPRRSRLPVAAARSWSCTTSRISDARTRFAVISWPTCRTNSAHR